MALFYIISEIKRDVDLKSTVCIGFLLEVNISGSFCAHTMKIN